MRYLFTLLCSFLLIGTGMAYGQDSTPRTKPVPPSQLNRSVRPVFNKTRDSLARIRFRRRRQLDSVRRIHLRDSLRAGYSIYFKGRTYTASTPAGRRLADSLDHPARYLRPKLLLTHADSAARALGLKLRAAKQTNPVTAPAGLATAQGASTPDQPLRTGQHPLKKRAADSVREEVVVPQARPDTALIAAQTRKADSIAKVNLPPAKDEVVIDDSIPAYLKPVSALDTLASQQAAVSRYIHAHYHLDSLRQRLAETGPAMIEPVIIDRHRPYARTGMIRNARETWIVWILLVTIGLVTLVKVRFPKDLSDIVESLFNDRMIKSNRDTSLIYSPSFIFMFLCFCLTAALAIYEYLHFLHVSSDYHGFTLYAIMTGCILLFFFFKLIAYRLSGLIFNIDRMVQPYLSFQYITIAGFTLFSIPFLVVFSFYNAVLTPHLVIWIPFIFLAFLLFLYVRSIVFFISNFELPKFYLFLYFCTLEICPLIIVFKLING